MVELPEVLEPHRALIEPWLRPVIWVHVDEPGRGLVGQSRIGGTPDLPASVAWPRVREHPIDYLLQINLAELPRDANTPALPRKGMLWLYEVWNSPSVDQLFVDTSDEPLKPSEQLAPDSYYAETVEPHTLRFRAGYDLPRWTSAANDELEDSLRAVLDVGEDEAWEATHDAIHAAIRLLADGALGRIFGWAGGVGHDIHEDAAVYRLDPAKKYDYAARIEMDLTDAASWQNLITIDSFFDIGLLIGDAGSTTVLIHEHDLAAGDLGKVYVTNESS